MAIAQSLVVLSLVGFSFVLIQTSAHLILTGVIDGPLLGRPKALEFYVIHDVANLSIYGFGVAKNGGGTRGEEFTFPPISGSGGDFIYVSSEALEFKNYFGFPVDYVTRKSNADGDDAIELFKKGNLVDVFGYQNVDGTNQPWEYKNGWAYRASGSWPSTTFDLSEWTFSGVDALDGSTVNNQSSSPMPVGIFATSMQRE